MNAHTPLYGEAVLLGCMKRLAALHAPGSAYAVMTEILAQRFGLEPLPYDLTVSNLSKFTDLDSKTVARALAWLQDKKIIKTHRKNNGAVFLIWVDFSDIKAPTYQQGVNKNASDGKPATCQKVKQPTRTKMSTSAPLLPPLQKVKDSNNKRAPLALNGNSDGTGFKSLGSFTSAADLLGRWGGSRAGPPAHA